MSQHSRNRDRADEPGQPVKTADGVTVALAVAAAAAAAAGLLPGRAASRHTARLLAAPERTSPGRSPGGRT